MHLLPGQINDVLDNDELSDQEKLRALIKLDYLKTQVGV